MGGSIGRWAVLAMGLLLARPAYAACVIDQVADLPITMHGLRPMLHVKMEGTNQQLLLDSGAFFSLLSPAVATALKVRERGAAGAEVQGVGGGFVAKAGYVKSLTFGKVTMSNVGFMIGGSETGGAGLLGQDVLHGFDVEYDFARGAVHFLHPKDCAGQALAYWAPAGYAVIDVNATTQLQPHTIGPVYVNGVRLRALFDTGAATTVMTKSAAARLGAKPGGPKVEDAGFASGIGRGVSKTWIAPFASFKIGQEEIRNIRLRFGEIGDEDYDMLLGADFFLSHHVLISNSQNKLYFTYNGGPVFNLAHEDDDSDQAGHDKDAYPSAETPPPLKTAAEYAQRAASRASRRDLPGALADFDQAIAKEPRNPDYLDQRAMLHRRLGHEALALADLDKAIETSPTEAELLLHRAGSRVAMHDEAGALADLDRAAATAPEQADLRRSIAGYYERAGRPDKAVGQYSLWLKAHPVDNKRAGVLNGRCWARALAGKELDQAIDDCNAALYLAPRSADILDSRGLVRLRQGDLDRALSDYQAALTIDPKTAWSLLGRGLIERKLGDGVKGDADVAAALKLDKDIDERAKRYGIVL